MVLSCSVVKLLLFMMQTLGGAQPTPRGRNDTDVDEMMQILLEQLGERPLRGWASPRLGGAPPADLPAPRAPVRLPHMQGKTH